MSLINTCQVCGAEESLDGLLLRMIEDDTVRRLIGDVITKSFPLGGLVVRYLRLHKPEKQKLRMGTVGKLLMELVPDVQRAAIERNGRMWAVSEAQWQAAFQAVFDQAGKGTVVLPLQGNGYLYSVLMRLADRAEAKQEVQTEAERRHGPKHTASMPSNVPDIVAVQQFAQFGGKDPALAKLDEDSKKAAPMPESVRERIAALKRGSATNSTNQEQPSKDQA